MEHCLREFVCHVYRVPVGHHGMSGHHVKGACHPMAGGPHRMGRPVTMDGHHVMGGPRRMGCHHIVGGPHRMSGPVTMNGHHVM